MINGKYFIIGGAGIGNDDFSLAADEMISVCGKKDPVFLFIGFAQLEPVHGFEYYGVLFAGKGCVCGILTNEDAEDGDLARAKIDSADIVFIMGGNTGKLLRTLRKYGIDKMLRSAAERGAVMAGFSAGAICLCSGGASKNEDYIVEDGIGCVDLFFCPHPMDNPERYEFFKKELEKRPGLNGLACDGAALEIVGDQYRSFVFCPDGHINEKCKHIRGVYSTENICEEWRPVEELFN